MGLAADSHATNAVISKLSGTMSVVGRRSSKTVADGIDDLPLDAPPIVVEAVDRLTSEVEQEQPEVVVADEAHRRRLRHLTIAAARAWVSVPLSGGFWG